MMDQPTHEPDAFTWLTPDDQARLVAFKAYAVNHPRLDEVDMQLTQAILEPAGFAHVLVYGPSGVGKTTMLQRVATRLRGLCTPMAAPQAWWVTGLIVAIILATRFALLAALRQPRAGQLTWVAPRGLITVLLFLAAAEHLALGEFPFGTVLLVVLITSTLVVLARRGEGGALVARAETAKPAEPQ